LLHKTDSLSKTANVVQTAKPDVEQNRPEESIKTDDKMAYTFIKAKSFMP
jgi:hypothetical protein